MTVEERSAKVQRKVEQYEHQQLLRENCNKEAESKINLRRKTIIGEMFIKHFPIALQFTPGRSYDEDNQIFKPLDDYMELLAESQQSYQGMENALSRRH